VVSVVDGREICEVCGFEWAVVDPSEVSARVEAASASIADLLTQSPSINRLRPEEGRWSCHEYAAHVRDVLLTIRDRLVLTAIEDTPTPPMLHRDERVALGLYDRESDRQVIDSLRAATELFATTFDVLAVEHAERTLYYSALFGGVRTFAWTGAQAVHECEHHLSDVRENVERLARN
jgi:hypothetical protein